MNAIEYAKFSEIALAAYGAFETGDPSRTDLTAAPGFSISQADHFITNWLVATPTYSDPISDFQATLFQEKLPGGGTGSFVLALRGTESAHDLTVTDAEVATSGVAVDQIVAMYNYVQRLKTATGDMAQQVKLVLTTIGDPAPANGVALGLDPVSLAPRYLVPATSEAGLGAIPAGATIDLAGHSLGGHLAMAFDRLFPDLTAHVFAYNAPGFKDSPLVNILFAALGGQPALEVGKISNIVADQAANGKPSWSAIAGLHSRPGTAVDVPIENQLDPALVGNLVATWNHSLLPLTDALILQAAFTRLNPSFTAAQFGQLFKAGSNTVAGSLECALDTLRTVFIGSASNDTNKTPTGDREAFFNNLTQLQNDAGFQALSGQVQLVPTHAGFSSAAQASTNTALAYRYALLELLPVAVVAGTDAQNQTLYGAYTQRLSLYDANTGQGELTQSWIQDRSTLLQALITRNTSDLASTVAFPGKATANYTFTDLASGQTVQFRGTAANANAQEAQQVMFGNDLDNGLIGSDAVSAGNGDRLYGGKGNDYIDAKGGNDYLEGNAGTDALTGGAGNDTLLGGADADTLNGGLGADWLYGGAGTDTYQLSSGELFDVIQDSDGNGTLWVDGVQLTGGKKAGDHYWISADGAWGYLLTDGGDLVISQGSSQDRITIRDWQGSAGNHLGIVLDDTPAPVTPQSGALFFTGDQRAKLIGIETRLDLGPGSARYNIDAWSETTWARDGTLSGGVARAGFSDKLRGTSNSIAACGRSVSFAGLFGIKLGAFEGRKRCWRGRREPLRPLTSQGTRAPSMTGVSQ